MHSLKNRFLLLSILIILSLSLISWSNNTITNKIAFYTKTLAGIQELKISLLQMRRTEKDFFLRKDVKYIEKFYALYESNLEQFKAAKLHKELLAYFNVFLQISKKMNHIGFTQNNGLKKAFREHVHILEDDLKNDKSLEHLVAILQLRRHEKDFLLRLDDRYILKHQKIFQTLKTSHELDTHLEHLNNYNNSFLELTQEIKYIGLNEKSGLRYEMRKSAHNIEDHLSQYISTNTPLIQDKIHALQLQQQLFYFLFLLFLFTLLIIFLKPINNAFALFKAFFSNFKNANQRIDISKIKFNELHEISRTINKMLASREAIEKELVNARDEALHLQKVKDQFITNMSHELRTPLNAVIGFSTILQTKLPNESQTITPIVESSKHLLNIINDILDLSKLQNNKFEIKKEVFKCEDRLRTYLHDFEYSINAKHISYELNSNIDQDLYLNGDWLRLSQVFSKLLANAIKFTPDNGNILLEVNYLDNYLSVSVQDDGIGIAEENQEKIFHPFEQEDSSHTKEHSGAGLGLSICKAIIKGMDGELKIESIHKKGAKFSFSVPIEKVDPPKDTSTEDENSEIQLCAHVLIAEDNKTNQLLISMLLDDLGITYDIANDGVEAVDMFYEEKHEIVLMDENMPNMNGVEAMKKIKANASKNIPIIAVTANVMKGDESRLLESGMDAFIPKPIDTQELIETLSLFINKT